jgi:hypothetical protein
MDRFGYTRVAEKLLDIDELVLPMLRPSREGGRPRGRGVDALYHRIGLDHCIGLEVVGYSRPGNPTDNAFIEAFNFRAECLNARRFLSLADARKRWRIGASTTTNNARTGRSAKCRRSCD